MENIAILTCSNVTQDLGCPSFQCFEAIREKTGLFDQYKDKDGVQLLGIINCAGCPTTVAPEKLLRRFRSLIATGVDAVHLSTCVTVLCPFKKKYLKLLEENFPGTKIVEGTHGAPAGIAPEKFYEYMKAGMKRLLIQPQTTMADAIEMMKNKG